LRFAASAPAVSGEDILRICRPLLAPGSPPGLFASLPLASIDPPESSGPASLTFVGPKTPLRVRENLRAALIVAEAGVEPVCAAGGAPVVLRVASLPAALSAVLASLEERLHREAPFVPGPDNRIAPTAVVEGCLEGGVTVGAGAFVGRGSYVGAGTRIEPNAVIQEHCHIGRDCVIQSGAVIGCAGFGFYPRLREGESEGEAQSSSPPPSLAAMPHLAGVVIGAECFIGANSVVAAGVLEPTRLGRGCKLDSHVQIAHNVRLGDGCLLASQSGIAGSTVAGHRLRMGGASSVDGHLKLGHDVSVAACSGVTKDVPDGATVAGFPARPIGEWRREQIRRRARREDADAS
jgi:UDP-3-O-[3-hydroxymyristoyl] glucosamine N-acyltransferase